MDFSTGSVGLGPAMTAFSSIVQDYLRRHHDDLRRKEPGRMIAVVGDAEMDEGNMYEALWEGWKHDLGRPGLHRVATFFERSRPKKAQYSILFGNFERKKSGTQLFSPSFRLFPHNCSNFDKIS